MNTAVREKFEEWAGGTILNTEHDPEDDESYFHTAPQLAWEAWQARQPEIDALKEKLESREAQMETVGSIERELRNELARLIAENERLRKLLSAAPTPPEVEPVAWITPGMDLHDENPEGYSDWTPLYTSPPSPKASWDAEGNPLNLEAAARDAEELLTFWAKDYGRLINDDEQEIIDDLRKFLKDPHG